MAAGDADASGSPSKLIRHRKACREYYERNKERLRAAQRVKARQRRAREREQKRHKTVSERCCCCGQLIPPTHQKRGISEDHSEPVPENSEFESSPREQD